VSVSAARASPRCRRYGGHAGSRPGRTACAAARSAGRAGSPPGSGSSSAVRAAGGRGRRTEGGSSAAAGPRAPNSRLRPSCEGSRRSGRGGPPAIAGRDHAPVTARTARGAVVDVDPGHPAQLRARKLAATGWFRSSTQARSEPAKDSKPRPRGLGSARPEQLQRDLGIRDLSGPGEGPLWPPAIQVLTIRAVERLSRAWNYEVRWYRGPRLVPVAENYGWLGYAAGAIT
jgi:hypothetical protein